MSPLILLLLGLLLIFLEFYLPGAVLGIIGGLMVFASIILFAVQIDVPWIIALYILAVGLVLGLLIKFALWRIRTARSDCSIYSDADQEGYVASHYDSLAIGKRGIVLTDLKPGGHILIEGNKMQAISQSGYITKGSEVIVVGGQEESLIVKPIKKDLES